jgi:hypothetical protein
MPLQPQSEPSNYLFGFNPESVPPASIDASIRTVCAESGADKSNASALAQVTCTCTINDC